MAYSVVCTLERLVLLPYSIGVSASNRTSRAARDCTPHNGTLVRCKTARSSPAAPASQPRHRIRAIRAFIDATHARGSPVSMYAHGSYNSVWDTYVRMLGFMSFLFAAAARGSVTEGTGWPEVREERSVSRGLDSTVSSGCWGKIGWYFFLCSGMKYSYEFSFSPRFWQLQFFIRYN